MKTTTMCPPLTPDNILTLRGQPATKLVSPNKCKDSIDTEEWIYYNELSKTKELYCFKNERLIGYKANEIFA